jgi:hypothetical protein
MVHVFVKHTSCENIFYRKIIGDLNPLKVSGIFKYRYKTNKINCQDFEVNNGVRLLPTLLGYRKLKQWFSIFLSPRSPIMFPGF